MPLPYPKQEEPIKRMTKIVNSLLARPDSTPFREPVDWRLLELHDYPEIIKKMMDLGTIKRQLDRQQYRTAAAVAADIRLVWSNCMTYNTEGSDFWLLAKNLSKRFEDRYRKVKAEFDVGEDLEEDDEEDDDDEEEEEEDDEEEDEEDDEEEEAEFEMDELSSSNNKSSSTPNTSAGAATSRGGGGANNASSSSPTLDARARFASNLLLLNGTELGHVVRTIECECPAAIETPRQAIPEKLEIVVDHLDAALFSRLGQFVQEKAAQRRRKLNISTTPPAINDLTNKRKRKR